MEVQEPPPPPPELRPERPPTASAGPGAGPQAAHRPAAGRDRHAQAAAPAATPPPPSQAPPKPTDAPPVFGVTLELDGVGRQGRHGGPGRQHADDQGPHARHAGRGAAAGPPGVRAFVRSPTSTSRCSPSFSARSTAPTSTRPRPSAWASRARSCCKSASIRRAASCRSGSSTKAGHGFDEPARDALRQSKFSPARTSDGQAVDYSMTYTYVLRRFHCKRIAARPTPRSDFRARRVLTSLARTPDDPHALAASCPHLWLFSPLLSTPVRARVQGAPPSDRRSTRTYSSPRSGRATS